MRIFSALAICLILLAKTASPAIAQHDPGVRGGFANTSGMLQYNALQAYHHTGQLPSIDNPPIPRVPLISPHPVTGAGVTDNEAKSFLEGINRAGQLESTCDNCAMVPDGSPALNRNEMDPFMPQFNTNSNGLGARHNADQCFACHSQPTLGGSGGFLVPNAKEVALNSKPPNKPENPQFDLIPHRFGRLNVVPGFEEQFGPIREVRFKYKIDATGELLKNGSGNLIPDGGVHQLWTVRGTQGDATIGNCALTQPDFEKQASNGNIAFRIPLQMLGLGLIESIQDREILARHDATALDRRALKIDGHPNISGNDGTITRFGWKAQNKSITMFAGEAYNVEMGITNELFPTATEENPDCQGNNKPEPNDVTRTQPNDTTGNPNQSFNNPLHILADWMQFQIMMRFTEAPLPDPNPSTSAQHGRDVFNTIGCGLCHTPRMQTAPVMNSAVLQDRPVNLYSDLFVHHMGSNLADGISQGQAAGDEFRTTPLWGVGQRLFFLHDGRTSDLTAAIRDHRSPADDGYPASEANLVIDKFDQLSRSDKQAVLDFLRSL